MPGSRLFTQTPLPATWRDMPATNPVSPVRAVLDSPSTEIGDRTDAEDLLQEVFVRVWTRAGRYDPRLSNPRTWLVAITRNAAIDRLRSRQVRPVTQPVDPGLPGPGPGPEAQAIAADQRTRLDGCLDELDADKAQAVRRAYLDGWSYEELARDADVPLNTMKTWLRRSLQRLRACMDQFTDPE